ncbi:lipase family protein [Nocardia sp. CDC159]|uniref:Lipase family protein n=1 Tax=Nocardia pulmonis TaxID=2951408 RepID=A0A9X2IXE6_9NOCA|nr:MULTISPECIES: lipase family protein [Nocardia]MCM6775298.1 lipase family protein [Nocardia pulmonis]MCM6787968.1 lipase family protein [Nocardia sp. CDC159]
MRRTIVTLAAAVLLIGPPATIASAEPEGQAPGTLVANEPLPQSLWIEGTGGARRLTYWSQTSEGKPALSTGVIFVPAGTPPPGGWRVVSWEHGTTGVGDACAPSTLGRIDLENRYLATWMRQGYAVVATDYIGLGTPGGHAFLDARAEAHAGIDMVRAAHAADDSLSTTWVAVGQSQGGGAAVATAALATSYAPELDYRGAVATGPASSLQDAAIVLSNPMMPDLHNANVTAYATYIINGIQAARPGFDLDSYLTPLGKELATAAQTLCFDDMVARSQGIEPKQLIARPLSEGEFSAVAHEVMDLPLTGYDRPLFIGQGLDDTDEFPEMTAKLVADLEAHGVRPEVHFYPGKDHLATVMGSLPDSLPFVARVFA